MNELVTEIHNKLLNVYINTKCKLLIEIKNNSFSIISCVSVEDIYEDIGFTDGIGFKININTKEIKDIIKDEDGFDMVIYDIKMLNGDTITIGL